MLHFLLDLEDSACNSGSMKKCPKCGKRKKIEDFGRDRSRRDGRFPWCRKCHAGNTKRWRGKLTEAEDQQRRAKLAQWRARRDANAEARKRYLSYTMVYSLKRRYGIDAQTFLRLASHQDGKCAICQAPLKKNTKTNHNNTHIDHDHKTGKVRGLLCGNCNNGLGRFQDDITLLQAAVVYLMDPPARKMLHEQGDD